MDIKILEELEVKLKGPLVYLEKVANKQYISERFGEVAFAELKEANEIVRKLKNAVSEG